MKHKKEGPPQTAISQEQKGQKGSKAKRILIGVDAHLESYQAASKIDNGAVGVAQSFRSKEALLLRLEKQREQAEEVVVVCEAGPLGYSLYRDLSARGIKCLVCAPKSDEQKRKRRKNNSIDARSLVSHLFNYLNGNEQALQLVRVPTPAQEQARLASRQHDALVQERKRLGAMGNSLLLSQGYGSSKNWCRRKSFERLSQVLSSWGVELLNTWVDLLRALDEKIQHAKVSLAKQCQEPRPKGVGAPSLLQLGTAALDWSLYSSGARRGGS